MKQTPYSNEIKRGEKQRYLFSFRQDEFQYEETLCRQSDRDTASENRAQGKEINSTKHPSTTIYKQKRAYFLSKQSNPTTKGGKADEEQSKRRGQIDCFRGGRPKTEPDFETRRHTNRQKHEAEQERNRQ